MSRERTWLVCGPGGLAHHGELVRWLAPVHPEAVTPAEARERADAPATAIIAGASAKDTVVTADSLLARGVVVLVDTADRPALGAALGAPLNGRKVVRLRPQTVASTTSRLLRLRDVVATAIGLALVGPVLVALAALVRWTTGPPAFYRTTVVGRDGRPFVWRKLRTMRPGTPEDTAVRREQYRRFVRGADQPGAGASRKIVDRRRVTPLGRVLRRNSLDELPQLWNVLRGDMALVGPRPCLPYEFDLQENWQRLRFRAPAGLTGPWQAYGRSRVSFDEMALMDYCYGRVRGVVLDTKLVLRTLRIVGSGEGGA